NAPGSAAVASPTGMVAFSEGATLLGSGTLSTSGGVTTAALSLNSLSTGSHTITATYAGDGNFNTSSGNLAQSVTRAGTTTALSSSVNPSVSGQSVTLIATVTVNAPGSTAVASPSGTVTFKDGSTTLGTP